MNTNGFNSIDRPKNIEALKEETQKKKMNNNNNNNKKIRNTIYKYWLVFVVVVVIVRVCIQDLIWCGMVWYTLKRSDYNGWVSSFFRSFGTIILPPRIFGFVWKQRKKNNKKIKRMEKI